MRFTVRKATPLNTGLKLHGLAMLFVNKQKTQLIPSAVLTTLWMLTVVTFFPFMIPVLAESTK